MRKKTKFYISLALFVLSMALPVMACKESKHGDTFNGFCQTAECIRRNRKDK